MDDFTEFLRLGFALRSGASNSALTALRQAAAMLPGDYLSFLAYSNGAEGPCGENHYLVLWAAEDVLPCNSGYGVAEFTPGLVLIGTDGAGTGFGFDCRSDQPLVVEVPLAGLNWHDATVIAPNFETFLKSLFEERTV